MEDTPRAGTVYEIECPHCHKSFEQEAITGEAARHAGFKCPHCKLFVAWERVDEAETDPGS